MEIRELVTFLSLSKTLNYQRSAAELQYAPSTLKKHISNLEMELRVPLFEKRGRSIQITQEGCRFIEYAQNLVSDYNKAVEQLSARKPAPKPLTIAGCEANLLCEMEESVQAYSAQCTDPYILKSICSNSAVQELVKCGAADVGVYYSLDDQPISGLESVMLYRERLHWMAYENHPLLKKKNLHYEDFSGQIMITQHLDCCFINDGLQRIRNKGIDSVELFSLFLCNAQEIDQEVLRKRSVLLRPHAIAYSTALAASEYLDVDEEPSFVWNRVVVRPEMMQDERIKNLLVFLKKTAGQRIASDSASYMPYHG